MEFSNWEEADSATAKQIWADYQQHHDLSDRVEQTVGIDPVSGRLWFGESIQDIVAQRDAEGLDSPLFFARVGSDIYFRKKRPGWSTSTWIVNPVPLQSHTAKEEHHGPHVQRD